MGQGQSKIVGDAGCGTFKGKVPDKVATNICPVMVLRF